MVYNIYTENKRLRKIRKILDRLFNGYTLTFGEGRYNNLSEKALVITILPNGQEGYLYKRVVQAAEEIKELNNQNCVLISIDDVLSVKEI